MYEPTKISTRDIAKLVGKPHSEVMEGATEMLKELGIKYVFGPTDSYVNDCGEACLMYHLGSQLSLLLLTGYDLKRRKVLIDLCAGVEGRNTELVFDLC